MPLGTCVFLVFTLMLIFPGMLCGVDVNAYDDTVYLYLGKLQASGLLKTHMDGQRPLSRSSIAKLVAEARANAKEGNPMAGIISELESEFADDLSNRTYVINALDSFSLSYAATNQEESPDPAD